jgi:hypothetical protein
MSVTSDPWLTDYRQPENPLFVGLSLNFEGVAVIPSRLHPPLFGVSERPSGLVSGYPPVPHSISLSAERSFLPMWDSAAAALRPFQQFRWA